MNCLCELGLEARVIPASVVRARLATHGVSDADVETAWAFLESEPASAYGEHEPTQFLMADQ